MGFPRIELARTFVCGKFNEECSRNSICQEVKRGSGRGRAAAATEDSSDSLRSSGAEVAFQRDSELWQGSRPLCSPPLTSH